MSVKSSRVTILTTPDFKKFLSAEAKARGVSVSELVRVRCTAQPVNQEDETLLASLVEQVNNSTVSAEKSLAQGLKDVSKALDDIRQGRA